MNLQADLAAQDVLAEVNRVIEYLTSFFLGHQLDLAGRKILVTAGPTQEPIDAVRYVSNRSSGKMGFALATAAANRGAEVRLISGPVSLETPRNVLRESVSTAEEMLQAVVRNIEWCDTLVMTAAVADYKVASPSDRKIKKSEFNAGQQRFELVETADILRSISSLKGDRTYIGFALETEDEIANARAKLSAKSLDLIVVNNAREEGAGFGTDTNKVTILKADGSEPIELPLLPKYEVGMRILDLIKG